MTILEAAAGVLAVLLVAVITTHGVLTHRRVQATINRILRRQRR